MLFALPKGTSGSLAIRHSDQQAVLGPVKVLPNARPLEKKRMFCFGRIAGNTLPLRPVLLRFYPRRFPPKRNPGSGIL